MVGQSPREPGTAGENPQFWQTSASSL